MLAWCLLIAHQALVWAQTSPAFPRGPGLYYHPAKLLAVLFVYCCWLRTCWWASRDCQVSGLTPERWVPVLLAGGAFGLVAVWVLPVFWAGYLALVALYLGPTLVYVARRNEDMPDDRKVLTPQHLRQLLRRYLGVKVKGPEVPEKDRPIPITFLGKSAGSTKADRARVARAEESQHYRAALKLVNDAILARATDIHLEPTKDELTVRFRIDGILVSRDPLPRGEGDAVINIFKVLADLDITEKRKPQDGGFAAEVANPPRKAEKKAKPKAADEDGDEDEEQERFGATEIELESKHRQVDFRVATAGSVVGEKLVMRILDRARQVTSLSQLGLRDKLREQVNTLVAQPHGLFIVCGPTGAGKSTTLYACLAEIDRFQKNVITVEDPVEYQLDNVTQIEINRRAGKTFASELRSILRQDPDVILVGEVRDQETAEIACQAAQTGHMVFTTLHANDTITALARLIDLKVQPFLVASAVSAILGQRLVRVLCPKCKVAYRPNPDLLRKANLPADRIKNFYRPPADEDECPHCGGTGYFGRTGVFELLVITDPIRELVRDGFDERGIRAEAAKSGMVVLQQDGMRQVIEGVTSIEELLRVTK